MSDPLEGAVYVYDAHGTSQPPLTSIRNLSQPAGLWVDANDDLYVAESGKDQVSVFHPNGSMPYTVLIDPKGPTSVCGDASGTVYVPSSQKSIEIYPPGATKPNGHLTDPNANSLEYCQVSKSGNLFVSYSAAATGGVDEFLAGSSTPTRLICCIANITGIALYGKSGLIVQQGGSPCMFALYFPPYTHGPKKVFPCAGIVSQIVLDQGEKHLWAVDGPKRTADEYLSKTLKEIDSTSPEDLNGPYGVAVSPADTQ